MRPPPFSLRSARPKWRLPVHDSVRRTAVLSSARGPASAQLASQRNEREEGLSVGFVRRGQRCDRSLGVPNVLENGRLVEGSEVIVVGVVSRLLKIQEGSRDVFDRGVAQEVNQSTGVLGRGSPSGDPLAYVLERLVRKRAREPELVRWQRTREQVDGARSAEFVVKRVVGRRNRSAKPDWTRPTLGDLVVGKLQ